MPIPEVASSAVWWQPALSAVLGSIVGGLLTGTFALKVIAKQQQAQLRREFMLMRQKWVEDMRERIPGIISTAGWFYLAKIKSRPPSQASEVWDADTTSQTLKLAQQITQVELMLDPANEAHVNLRQAMIDVRRCAFSSGTQLNQFEEAVNTLTNRCLVVMRKESSAPPFLGEASASP